MQIEQQHHHQSYHYQQQQQQQQPLRQEDHEAHSSGMLPSTQTYCYLHGNNSTGHYSDALATSSTNMYAVQQQQQQEHHYRMSHERQQQQQEHAAHITLSGSTVVPMTTNAYHDDNQNNNNITTSPTAADSLAERDQLPSIEDFDSIVQEYLGNLSSKKRDKALIDRHRYSLIIKVLKDPRNTATSTAQFRFWVKKMFQLIPLYGDVEVVCHDNKPVAMREEIYAILVRAHKEVNHGGRDKTSALVRRRYSWIPKELIARFVRYCPFCISRRNGSSSPPIGLLPRSPPGYTMYSTSTSDAAAPARGNSYSAQPAPMSGLPYRPTELKSGFNENDDLSITNKNDCHTWPSSNRSHYHQHHQQQRQYFSSPTQPPIDTTVTSPVATPILGAGSVDFCITSSTNSSAASLPPSTQQIPSCSNIPPVTFEAPNALFHQSALIPQCDITSFGYSNTSADVSANEHVNHSPSYNTMCYAAADGSEISLSMTENNPSPTQPPQFQEEAQQHNNNLSTVGSYYYTGSQQPQKQNDFFYDDTMNNNKKSNVTRKLHRPRANRANVVLHYPLYSLSSPSPSSSFSSSSSSSASSTSSPVSPTDSATNAPFNTVATTSSSLHYNTQSMYMQHPPSSTNTPTITMTTSSEALRFINQQQEQRQF